MKKINILVAAFVILIGVSVFALPEKSDAYFGVDVNFGSGNYYNDGYGYGYGYGGYGYDDYGYGSNYYGGGYNSYYGGGYGGYYQQQNPLFNKKIYNSRSTTVSGYPYLNGGYSGVPGDYVSFIGPKFFYPQNMGSYNGCGSYYCN